MSSVTLHWVGLTVAVAVQYTTVRIVAYKEAGGRVKLEVA